ncbi:MAG: phosphoribosylformylglycinamidine synthase I [Phycisphaerae bacterium]
MDSVRVLVLRAAGINCDEETMHAWRLAGAAPQLVHINRVVDTPSMIDDVDIVTIPGGFSYGDDIAAGVILAQRLMDGLAERLRGLVDRGGGVLGICNGFQVLVKAGLLPGGPESRQLVTVTYNDSARFEARWVRLKVVTDRCPFLTAVGPRRSADREPHANNGADATYLELPVEHAEGKVVTADDTALRYLRDNDHIAVCYVDGEDGPARYPANPNGSVAGIAGLCDETGRIFGLMPHPDRHFDHTQHPLWTRRRPTGSPDGLTVFQNAVVHWRRRNRGKVSGRF